MKIRAMFILTTSNTKCDERERVSVTIALWTSAREITKFESAGTPTILRLFMVVLSPSRKIQG
jgi:hypothetical protein